GSPVEVMNVTGVMTAICCAWVRRTNAAFCCAGVPVFSVWTTDAGIADVDDGAFSAAMLGIVDPAASAAMTAAAMTPRRFCTFTCFLLVGFLPLPGLSRQRS